MTTEQKARRERKKIKTSHKRIAVVLLVLLFSLPISAPIVLGNPMTYKIAVNLLGPEDLRAEAQLLTGVFKNEYPDPENEPAAVKNGLSPDKIPRKMGFIPFVLRVSPTRDAAILRIPDIDYSFIAIYDLQAELPEEVDEERTKITRLAEGIYLFSMW